jgi:hypothetical protein
MYCKGIRDDEGAWRQLESYLSERTEVSFSHGICDKCAEEKHPAIYNKRSNA